MKKMMFLAVMMVIAISAAATESWPTTTGKYPSWPTSVCKYPSCFDTEAVAKFPETKFPKFPSWPSEPVTDQLA